VIAARRIVRRIPGNATDALPDSLHPLLRRIYAGRNVVNPRELQYSLENLLPFAALDGIDTAVGLLAEALERNWKLLIVADYDADGATACALGLRALRSMAAVGVEYLVPDRFRHGYGLSPEIVDLAAAHRPDVIITVDNGISSIDGVDRAHAAGMRVLITDHHLPGSRLPAADAIVNPNLPGDGFPSKNLAGVGVMFYVMAALRARLRGNGWFERRGLEAPNLATLLDLVALGTVADLVPLDFNNRILVTAGLARIRAGRCVSGIAALLEAAKRNAADASCSDLGYFVAPRLNAAGRLTDMSLGIECLLTDDPAAARRMALELDALNRERRQIQEQMQSQALAALAVPSVAGDPPPALCLFNEDWHAGVVGVLASRIKDQVHRPVVAFAREGQGLLKGSGRSIDGVHLRDAIADVATRRPGLIARFGGHAMAAGLSLAETALPEFSDLFTEEIARRLPADADGVLLSDGELAPGELTVEMAALIRAAGPWGAQFPEPLFDGVFLLNRARTVGERHLKLTVCGEQAGRPLDAIGFNMADDVSLDGVGRVHLAYRLDINEYNGRRSLQLVVEQLEVVSSRTG
jgi:single-stranded-DNA-specific exonuclease